MRMLNPDDRERHELIISSVFYCKDFFYALFGKRGFQ